MVTKALKGEINMNFFQQQSLLDQNEAFKKKGRPLKGLEEDNDIETLHILLNKANRAQLQYIQAYIKKRL